MSKKGSKSYGNNKKGGYKDNSDNKKFNQNKKKAVRLFTSECVTVGHPDKVCDYISDSILTEILEQDKDARVAVETFAYTNGLVIAGEVTTKAQVNYEEVARKAIREIGYVHKNCGFDADTVDIQIHIDPQSADIALGTNDNVGGSGDQGMMIGGACNETSDFMPLPITMARALSVRLYDLISEHVNEEDPMLRADGKTQVTIGYGKGNVPEYVDTVVVSVSHSDAVSVKEVRKFVKENVIVPVVEEFGFKMEDVQNIFINPTGKFAIYGPNGDTGLTGRKIIVDTYGSYFGHGGGAFSGKDPSKTDRSGAYMARYIAKNIVAAQVADKCEIQLAYAIGVAKPVSININMFGTNKYPVGLICKAVYELFDMTPKGIADTLKLRSGKVDYKLTSVYGHFGEFLPEESKWPWEKTDKASEIANFCINNYINN